MVSALINTFLFKPPPARPYKFPMRIQLTTSRGSTIGATYISRRGANVTVLFSHGNAEDLNSCYWWLKKISEDLDVNLMAYDYTGYGCCEDGIPSERNCYSDIEAAYNYLTKEKDLNPEQIVLYGRSLGSGPSCFLAHKVSTLAGLILQSPFTSVFRVVLDLPITVIGDKFPNIDRIDKIQCPVFIIHGESDEIVPFNHGKALHEACKTACKTEPCFVKDMGHNSFGYDTEALLLQRLNSFLDYHVVTRRLWMKRNRASH